MTSFFDDVPLLVGGSYDDVLSFLGLDAKISAAVKQPATAPAQNDATSEWCGAIVDLSLRSYRYKLGVSFQSCQNVGGGWGAKWLGGVEWLSLLGGAEVMDAS